MKSNFDMCRFDIEGVKKGDVIHNVSTGEKNVIKKVNDSGSLLVRGLFVSFAIIEARTLSYKFLRFIGYQGRNHEV